MFLEYKEYEKFAKNILVKNKVKIDDLRIGELISYLMLADFKYNESIGNRDSYRIMYGNYWIKNFKRSLSKNKLMQVKSIEEFCKKDFVEDFFNNIGWEDLLNDERFPKICRKLLYLRYKEKYSIDELNKLFNIKTSREKIKWALKKLRNLKPEYLF